MNYFTKLETLAWEQTEGDGVLFLSSFFSFFLWFWKPASEKKKPIVMLVLLSVGFLFPCPPLCLCSQRKKETLWFLLLTIAEDDDSVEGLSHQHCHCLLSSVLFFFNSPFSPQFLFLFSPLLVFWFFCCL